MAISSTSSRRSSRGARLRELPVAMPAAPMMRTYCTYYSGCRKRTLLIALVLTGALVVGLAELAVRGWMVRAKTRPGRSCRAAVSGAAGSAKPLGVHVVRSAWACM